MICSTVNIYAVYESVREVLEPHLQRVASIHADLQHGQVRVLQRAEGLQKSRIVAIIAMMRHFIRTIRPSHGRKEKRKTDNEQ